jgi:type II secretory pathway component PulJ
MLIAMMLAMALLSSISFQPLAAIRATKAISG